MQSTPRRRASAMAGAMVRTSSSPSRPPSPAWGLRPRRRCAAVARGPGWREAESSWSCAASRAFSSARGTSRSAQVIGGQRHLHPRAVHQHQHLATERLGQQLGVPDEAHPGAGDLLLGHRRGAQRIQLARVAPPPPAAVHVGELRLAAGARRLSRGAGPLPRVRLTATRAGPCRPEAPRRPRPEAVAAGRRSARMSGRRRRPPAPALAGPPLWPALAPRPRGRCRTGLRARCRPADGRPRADRCDIFFSTTAA